MNGSDEGRLVIVDAIDGAGKYTAIKAMAEWLEQKHGRCVRNLSEYMRTEHRLPEPNDPFITEADVLISSEPTFCWIGEAIREELIHEHPDRSYDGRVAAQAFSLDRLVLFSRIILPFLRAKPHRWVLQERGVISSLAYQPLQDPTVTIDWLLSLEGNQLELSRPPDVLMLLHLASTEALRRIEGRREKVDGHTFENRPFQEQLIDRYEDPEVLAPYIRGGTTIAHVDAGRSPDEVAQDAISRIAHFLV